MHAITESKRVIIKIMDFNLAEYKKLIDMVSDSVHVEIALLETITCPVWCSIKQEYLELSRKTMKIVSPFPAPYLCETRFSSYVSTKTYHNRLNAQTDREIQLSSIKPDIKDL